MPVLYDPTILLLDIAPNEMKTYIHTKTSTCMFLSYPIYINSHPKLETTQISFKWNVGKQSVVYL